LLFSSEIATIKAFKNSDNPIFFTTAGGGKLRRQRYVF
jgi:hypothetical protein